MSWLGSSLMRLICPAAYGLPPRALTVRIYQHVRQAALAAGLARPVTLTPGDDDRVRLDALWLGHCDGAPRPIVVVCVGFAMSYEAIVAPALNFAQALDLQVLLYNGRGIGHSGGLPRSPSDAVADCQAALMWAHQRASKVAAYGISMGAAWVFLAAQAMAGAAAASGGRLGLMVLARAFSRLDDVVTAHLGAAVGSLAGQLLARADFPPLDLVQAMSRPLPATRVLVTQAAADRVVPPAAQLGERLGLAPMAWTPLPHGQTAFYLPQLGVGHVDRRFRNGTHDKIVAAWAQG